MDKTKSEHDLGHLKSARDRFNEISKIELATLEVTLPKNKNIPDLRSPDAKNPKWKSAPEDVAAERRQNKKKIKNLD